MAGRWTNYGEENLLNTVRGSQAWTCQLFQLPSADADDEDFSASYDECDYDGYAQQAFSFAVATDTGSAGTYYCVSTSNLVWTHSGDGSGDVNNTIYGYAIWSGSGGYTAEPFYYEFFASPVTMVVGMQFSFVPRISLVGIEDVDCE